MFQHIKKLLLGNGLAQAIQLMSLLVLSRLYPPSDFGVLAQIQAIATFSTIVATLQLHLATPLSQSEDEARTLTSHTQSIALLFTLTLTIPALLLGRIETYSLWLTLAIALINTYNGHLIYRGNFSAISLFYVTRACLVVIAQVLFAFLELQQALVLGTLIAETLAALYLMLVALDHRPMLCSQPRLLLKTAMRHKAFSIHGTSQELVSVAAFYAPLVLFGIYFDAATAGQYAMASRLVWAPTILVSKNIAQVLYHQHETLEARIKVKTGIQKRTVKLLAALFLVNLAAFFLTDLFSALLGNQWETASRIIPALTVWCSAFLLSTPFRVLCRSLKLQKFQLIIDLIFAFSIAACFMLTNFDPVTTTWILSSLGFIQNLAIAIVVRISANATP